MKLNALLLNRPTANQHIYSKECMEQALKKYQEQIVSKTSFVYNKMDADELDLKSAIGLVTSASIENDQLVCEIELLDVGPEWWTKELQDGLQSGSISVRPSGFGTCSRDGIIGTDYIISGFITTDKPA